MSQSIVAQELQAPLPDFKEDLRPDAHISGTMVVGLQRLGPAAGKPVVRAHIPAAWRGHDVCLNVWSANGLYNAQGSYPVSENLTGAILPMEFPTKYNDFLAELDHDEMAALTGLGSCDEEPTSFVITDWNGKSGEPFLTLNSFRADDVFVYVGDDPEPVTCEPVAAEIRTAYDVKCPLDLRDKSGEVPLEIYRYTNNQAAPPTLVTVFLPG